MIGCNHLTEQNIHSHQNLQMTLGCSVCGYVLQKPDMYSCANQSRLRAPISARVGVLHVLPTSSDRPASPTCSRWRAPIEAAPNGRLQHMQVSASIAYWASRLPVMKPEQQVR